MPDKISQAIHFITDAFDGITRKSSKQPAVFHSLEAGSIVTTMTDDKDVIVAALLHDTIEDTGVSVSDIEKNFGKRVTELVLSETEDKRSDLPPQETWKLRKIKSINLLQATNDIGVKMVFLGDKLSNMRGLYWEYKKRGADLWNDFNQKDPDAHHWYYRTIADALCELKDFSAWKEYDYLIKQLFKNDNREKKDEGSIGTI
ncbi:MAG: HD domain-containing protein [Clostridia bacterium]